MNTSFKCVFVHTFIRYVASLLQVIVSVFVCASLLLQKAVITNVSPDVLYLFRVQAVCQHDLRSDFSQTLLFRGTRSKPSTQSLHNFKLILHVRRMNWIFSVNACLQFCFSANTTRIFEGSRIVKTGMVSLTEDDEANFFLNISHILVVLLDNCFFSLLVSPSPQFLQRPQQTWLPSALVPPLGRPLASTFPLYPWQQGWAHPRVAARPQWRQW